MSDPIQYDIPLKVKPVSRYRTYLVIMSAVLGKPLTENNLEILERIYNYGKGVLTTDVRKMIANELGYSKFDMGNYVFRLKAQGFLEEGEKFMQIPAYYNLDMFEDVETLQLLFKLESPDDNS